MQDVARLEVQVQHAEPMRVVDGFGDAAAAAARRAAAAAGHRLSQPHCARLRPPHQLHRVIDQAVVLADLVDGDDVGMLQQRRVLRFAAQAWRRIRRTPTARPTAA